MVTTRGSVDTEGETGGIQPPLPAVPVPKRGGIHPTHGVYIGGSALDGSYKQTSRVTYKYARQKRTGKATSTIEENLIKTRDSTGTLKFNGNLEAPA